jgi:hypothetical protein
VNFSLKTLGSALIALFVVSAVPALAQDNSVSFGYQYQHLGDGGGIPMGFGADYSRALSSPPLSIVAAVDYGRTSESSTFLGVTADSTSSIITFAAGPRWTRSSGSTHALFAQVLGGVGVLRSSITGSAAGVTSLNISDSTSKFMLQPGAGVVHWLNAAWGLSGEVDYRMVFTEGESTNGVRLFLAARKKL